MRRAIIVTALLAVVLLFTLSACTRDTNGLKPAPGNSDPVVFDDFFGARVDFQAFLYSDYAAVAIDADVKHSGTSSLRVDVPDEGSYAGGAFVTALVRDLSGYDALTFWAKSSKVSTLNTVGFGNNNLGTSKYMAEWKNVPLGTVWRKYIMPVPDPDRLNLEAGLFFFAEEAENGTEGHEIWFDDIIFATVEPGTITDVRPEMDTEEVSAFIGGSVTVSGTATTFDVNGEDQFIEHMQGYFSFLSSDEGIVEADGENILVVGPGTAEITAELDGVAATGVVTVLVAEAPTVPAPVPNVAPSLVVNLFSDTYDGAGVIQDVDVTTWSADWPDMADVEDFQIGNDNIKAYTNLYYAGVLFEGDLIDATDLDYFHIDVWVPSDVVYFKVVLADFGDDGTYQGAPDSEGSVTITLASTPPLLPGSWTSLDIPIEEFMDGPDGLFQRAHLAQMLVVGLGNTAFIDNVYFYKEAPVTAPGADR